MSLAAPGTNPASNLELKLPHTIGSANQLLKVDGNGQLGWATDSTTDSTKLPLAGGTLTGDTTLANTKKVIFNHSSGAGAFIKHQSGHFEIISSVGNTYFASAGTLYLRTNGSTNALTLDTSQNATFEGWAHLKDNQALYIGSANDLSLFHDTTDCRIRYNHTVGSLKFQKNDNSDVLTINTVGDVTVGYAGNSLYFQNGFNDSKSRIQNGGASNSSNLRFYTRNSGTESEKVQITSGGSVNIGGDYTQTTTKVKITGTTGLNGIQLSQNGSVTQNLKLKGLNTQSSNDVGISLYNNSNNWCCQLYGTNGGTAYYGFLDGNWNQWDIKKQANGAFEVDEGSGLQRVLTAGNIGAGGALSNATPYVNQLRIGANSTTASTAGDDLVIEGSSDRGLSIIAGTSSSSNIYFGDSSDADVGRIAYQHNDNALDFSVNARTTALRIDQGGVQNYTGSSADNRYANVQVRHKTPYSTDGSYPGGTQSSTNQTVFSLYNESYGGNRMAFRSGQGHQFEIETKTRDLGSGSYNDADVYFRGQYDGALTDRYIIESGGAHIWKVRNGDTALNIDGNGVVKKPEHPYFVAQRSSVINSTGYQTFNTSVYNNGNHYSTSTGKFTAPTAGLYHFFCKINAYKRIDFQLRKNGTTTGSAGREIGQFNTSNQNGWYSHIVQRTFELASNDYVQVYVSNLTQATDPGEWLTFQGYLIG